MAINKQKNDAKSNYQTSSPLELLKENEINTFIEPSLKKLISKLEIFTSLDSTQTYLIDKARTQAKSGHIVLAEDQTAGRARHGRTWFTAFASSICFSLLWEFPQTTVLPGLSLAVAIAICEALRKLNINENLKIKWPNDIYWQQRKLAGILINITEQNNRYQTIIGIGLNIHLSNEAKQTINQPWVDLYEILGHLPSRNQLVGTILNELLLLLPNFTKQGLLPYLEKWKQFDITQNKEVIIHAADKEIIGIAQGINLRGELLVKDLTGQQHQFINGEVSLRLR